MINFPPLIAESLLSPRDILWNPPFGLLQHVILHMIKFPPLITESLLPPRDILRSSPFRLLQHVILHNIHLFNNSTDIATD